MAEVGEYDLRNGDTAAQSFHRIDYLFSHIRDSNSDHIHGSGGWKEDQKAIERHDALKREDGWYNTDWEGDASEQERRRSSAHRRLAGMAGLRWREVKELKHSVPHESRLGLCRGGPSAESIPERLKDQLSYNPPTGFKTISDRFEGILVAKKCD
ncbi:hypothetical protein A1O1_06484 [Capronia coronata CBS 617.96]|uniref:Uncharacterized protein n=1 Tax=Capronia coronata CBS 617.96 TaxID=1182541 RepID=W9Y8Z3_9EURO|nr:uncharacterized protein A1O1_06484 [Capronia coronata CBS 617.96]EXJ86115.1 hypothetical protein A1O1_06484 [Capronia coronata CBS 617.96]